MNKLNVKKVKQKYICVARNYWFFKLDLKLLKFAPINLKMCLYFIKNKASD